MKYIYFTLLLMVFVLSACQNQSNTDQAKDKVNVGYLNMVSSLTHFVAVENGYYDEVNLDVQANPISTSNLIAQELAAGHIDIGIELALSPLLKQLEKAPNTIKVFSTSNVTIENGFDAIVVKDESKLNSLKDLSGKKVGGFPGTTAKVSFLQLFSKKYPDLNPPTFIPLAPHLHIQALQSGDIDALFAYEPTLSTGKIDYHFREIFPSVYGTQFSPNPIGVGGVNQKWYEEHIELASRYFTAIDKAVDFIAKNPELAKSILAKSTKISEPIAQKMNTLPLSKSNEINLENLDAYLVILKDLEEISELPNAKDLCISQP